MNHLVMRHRGVTLLEVLVVVGLIGVLAAVLVPSLSYARFEARRMACVNNLRGLEGAHVLYMDAHNGRMVDAGHLATPELSWVEVLATEYGGGVDARSPLDTSPHFPEEMGGVGIPVEGTTDVYRRTSYGINNVVTRSSGSGYADIDRVVAPAETAHFVVKAFEGPKAGQDHVHPRGWGVGNAALIPLIAGLEVQLDAHGGEKGSGWRSVSGYSFLDGHAASLTFDSVYTDYEHNQFDPVNR